MIIQPPSYIFSDHMVFKRFKKNCLNLFLCKKIRLTTVAQPIPMIIIWTVENPLPKDA